MREGSISPFGGGAGGEGAESPDAAALRKVGPSLADAAARLEPQFLADWIAAPSGFRPSSRMPQFFGLHEHLDGPSRDQAERFEAVEIRGIIAQLQAVRRMADPLDVPVAKTAPPSAVRGKRLFQLRGCLACHGHEEFPEGQSTVGPELSRLGAKYVTPAGKTWLAGWIRDPAHYHPQTKMPNPFLEPLPAAEARSQPAPDPAADIAAWLLSSARWQPRAQSPLNPTDLDALLLEYLRTVFPERQAAQIVRDGIPAAEAGQISGDARILLGPPSAEKKLRYVGQRTLRRRGCSACHDIPGLEGAQPIGPALSDWGQKRPALLDFGQVQLLPTGPSSGGAGQGGAAAAEDQARRDFFTAALVAHRREGFLWQKLGAPRSFDYQAAAGKRYLEQLTMGRFTLTDAQREAIATFVLALGSQTPGATYVCQADRRGEAIYQGRKVLDQYGCAECHSLEMERWTLRFDPTKFPAPPAVADFDFLQPDVAPAALAASKQLDRRGLAQPTWSACRASTPRAGSKRMKTRRATRSTSSPCGSRRQSTAGSGAWAGRRCRSRAANWPIAVCRLAARWPACSIPRR